LKTRPYRHFDVAVSRDATLIINTSIIKSSYIAIFIYLYYSNEFLLESFLSMHLNKVNLIRD